MANPRYATLVSNVVLPLTLDADYREVEVTNLNGLDEVAFTVDNSTPAIGVDGSYVVTAGLGAYETVKVPTAGPTVVKLKSAAAARVSVKGIS